MGFDCTLKEAFGFIYKAPLEKGLIEYEYDHVLFGVYNNSPLPNQDEVSEWKWITLPQLCQEIAENPSLFSYWLRECVQRVSKIKREQ